MSPTTQPPLPPPVHTAHCRTQSPAVCDGTCIIGKDRSVPAVALIGIDVDGVVVPETFPGDEPAGFTGYPYRGPNSVGDTIDTTVWLNHEHGRWLAELVDHGAELVWASTWREAAAQFIAPRLGLPAAIPFIDVGSHAGARFGHSLKQRPVASYADAQPLAWLDDHFGGKDAIWATDRSEEGVPTLLIQTSPAEGLQREHIDMLIIWLEAQQLQPAGDGPSINPWLHVRAVDEDDVKARLENASIGVPDRELLHALIARRISYRSMDSVNLVIQLFLAAAAYARHLADAHENDLGFLYVREALGAVPEITDRLILDRSVRDNVMRLAFWALAQIAQPTHPPFETPGESVQAGEFTRHFEADSSIIRIDAPTIPPSHDRPGTPWFRATFTYRVDGKDRSIDYELGGGLDDTLDTITGAEMLYRMAGEARDGEDYQEYLDTYGPGLGVTREQWEQGESAVRARCREWIIDDTMWEEFLSIEPDA